MSVKGLEKGYETAFDSFFASALDNERLRLPGFVVMCRRGGDIYGPKAFGYSDLQTSSRMRADAMFRMYSMTKVMTNALALMLYDKGLFRLSDPVSLYLPAFDRPWSVVREATHGELPTGEIEVQNIALGTRRRTGYVATPAEQVMRIGHLMSETSGIGYDLWSDLDEVMGNTLCTKGAFHIANALRNVECPGFFTSTAILGQTVTLEEFCDTIARTGVLSTEPGQFSYGLGSAVLGRVIEIVYQRQINSRKSLSDIFHEQLFAPLQMNDATFYVTPDDPRAERIPTLYGVCEQAAGALSIIPAEHSCPLEGSEYSNHIDHVHGPGKLVSGDTGAMMPVADYGRFLDFLAAGGTTPDGRRLLSEAGVAALTGQWIKGLELDTGLAHFFRCAGTANSGLPRAFSFGWSITQPAMEIREYEPRDHPGECSWDGYANTSVNYYRNEDAWIIIAPQLIVHGPRGTEEFLEALRLPAVSLFRQLWRG
ncbi:MAG: serine hydrolase domain-containing protein [Roseovarius sp.]